MGALKKEEAEWVTCDHGLYEMNLKGEIVQTKEQLSTLASAYSGKLDRVFHNAIYGFEATMTEADAEKMSRDPSVAYIEQVSIVRAIQQSPATWGIDRVDQRDLPLSNTYGPRADGSGVTAYVIDTGVQISHDEFKDGNGQSRATWGINTSGDNDDRDCHGHGTHVAGTVGGLEYGVAKNVDIVAVKVLTCSGSGSTAGVIAGVEWAMNHAADNNISNKAVANMSLGGGFSQASNTAVKNLHESGVLTAVAAGNSNASACNYSPASEPAAITVGSTTNSDARSSFSNYGTCLDIFAPGSGITAAWIGSDTATNTISGTSMASPHVAGGLAIAISEGSTDAEGLILNTATQDKVTNPQGGSPNKLLYVGNVSPTTSPTPGPPTASPTPCMNGALKVSISTDNYPAETSWTLKNGCSGEQLLSGGSYTSGNSLYEDEVCAPANPSAIYYEFTINDSYGDGICCSYGSGSYKVEFDGTEMISGGQFGSEETKTFGNENCDAPSTDAPTASPTADTPSTPTSPPTYSDIENCVDSPFEFKLETSSGAFIPYKCANLARGSFGVDCPAGGVLATHCPLTCGKCGRHMCSDASAPFFFKGNEYSCDTLDETLCRKGNIKRTCRSECDFCEL